MSDNPHFVKVEPGKVDEDGWQDSATVTFTCRGDRASKCHQYPDCDCEYWEDGHEQEHPKVAHDECWMQGWFDNDAHSYAGDDMDDMDDRCVPPGLSRSGPIKTSFEIDYLEWEWEA